MVTYEKTIKINHGQLEQIEKRAVKNHRKASEELGFILQEKGGIPPYEEKDEKKEVAAH